MPGIVVGVDGSAHSKKALNWALTEAELRGMPLTVMAVSPVAADIFGMSAQHYAADTESAHHAEEVTRKLVDEVIAGRAPAPSVKVTVKAIAGLPADELVRASAGADLLVVGARGAGGFGRLMLGSVSNQVSHHALCPIVIVPPDEAR
ncbi:MAG: universal stress protein [Gemmatimonadota bacterium]